MDTRHYDPNKLKQLRLEKSKREGTEITQQAVAKVLNVHRQTIYRAEYGLDVPYELLCDLANYYQVPVVSLLHPVPLESAAAA